jgi:DNA-binding NarL/FixJ family response regulator
LCTVLIADDHPLFREALQVALGEALREEQKTVLEASSMGEACELAAAHGDIDLVLMDLRMPGMEGMSGLLDFRRRFPALPLVVVSASDDRALIQEAVAFGASGYIPKSLGKGAIAQALRTILDGGCFVPEAAGQPPDDSASRRLEVARRIAGLTPQQLKVLSLIAKGKPNKIIAYELGITEKTVKAHITVILRKLGVHSRTQAVLAAQAHFAAIG